MRGGQTIGTRTVFWFCSFASMGPASRVGMETGACIVWVTGCTWAIWVLLAVPLPPRESTRSEPIVPRHRFTANPSGGVASESFPAHTGSYGAIEAAVSGHIPRHAPVGQFLEVSKSDCQIPRGELRSRRELRQPLRSNPNRFPHRAATGFNSQNSSHSAFAFGGNRPMREDGQTLRAESLNHPDHSEVRDAAKQASLDSSPARALAAVASCTGQAIGIACKGSPTCLGLSALARNDRRRPRSGTTRSSSEFTPANPTCMTRVRDRHCFRKAKVGV